MMSEERKKEIIAFLENDETDELNNINRDEAKDFLDSLTKEENEYVFELWKKNRRKKDAKYEQRGLKDFGMAMTIVYGK